MCFTSGLVAALILLQDFAWADQCTSTKCTGQYFESNDMEWDKCWGSYHDDGNYPFACEEGYEVHDFSIGWYGFSYYTCCIAENTTAVNAAKCVDQVCTDNSKDCFVPECGTESMTCGSHEFPYANPTGASYYNKDVSLLLNHYVCCNMNISDIPPLICDSSEAKNRSKKNSIVSGVSAIISLISSVTIIWVIYRSKDGLSKASHRILTAMSISDIIFSLSFVDFGAASPKEYERYVWNAQGTEESCSTFGAMYAFGIICGPFYSASLNVHYLLVFKYTKKISRRVEPFLHLVPVATGVSATIIYILNERVDTATCRAGLPTILAAIVIVGLPLAIVFAALGMMYWTMRVQAKKMSKYGVGSLRESAQFAEEVNSERSDKLTQSRLFGWNSMSSLLGKIRKKRRRARAEQNVLASYNKSILTKAKLYTLACFFTYIFAFFSKFLFRSPVFDYLTSVFLPLQGFWNLLIFMHPKVTAAKNQSTNNEITWRQAIVKAFSPHGKQQTNPVQNKVNHPCPDNLDCNDAKTGITQKSSVGSKVIFYKERKKEVCDTEISSSAMSTLHGKNNQATMSELGSNTFASSLEIPYRKQQADPVQNQVNHPSPANLGCNDPKTESTKKNRSARSKEKSREEEKTEICDVETAPSAMSTPYDF